MTEVTAARRWLSRRRRNGCWAADGQELTRLACSELRLLCPGSGFSELSYIKYTEMKRKVVNTHKLRLSPNEEAFILKEDYERRRKLRLLQVREQERDIALQIREDIKQRRNQQFTRLAEELRAEWEESQTQKIQNLEKLYLASLRSMGEGHRQAKENEPDLDALAQRAAERKRKADLRHKEALKVQKNQKEILLKQKTWHIKARKEALLVEKERSAKITSLPPPPPTLFENIEVKRISAVKTNSSTYHHLHTFVNRETDTKQPDARLAAEEEAKRLEELQKQAAQERMERFEKAHVRGFQAMKKIHLAQNQEKLMKELKQLQQEDLARRRQTVAQMPPQLVELPYKRSEMKEDWQRELEFAFEDMYNADRKVKGNLILHLEPEPLPTMTNQIQDEELDLSMEQENLGAAEDLPVTEAEICSSETDVPLVMKTQQIPSKVLFKKLLNKIRSQKSLWTIKSMSEDESEMITTVSEIESKAPTVESGTIASEERTLSSGQEQVVESDTLTIESGPLASEDKPLSCGTNSGKEQEINETLPITTVAQSSVLLHPQEEAARIRMSARQKQIMEIEEQKQKQLELLEQIEQQKLRLETDCFRAQLEEEKRKKTQPTGVGIAPASCPVISDEDSHRQMIRNYQHQLLQQNRLHRQSVETARKRLLEYQTMLKGRCPSVSAPSLITDSVISVPSWKSERPTAISEHWDQDLGRIQESSPTKNNTAVSSDHHVISQLQDKRLSLSQPILSQQNNFKFLQEQLNIQKDSLQARREAQEVLYVHKQSELDRRVCSEQAEPSFPFQVAQHTFTSLPSADTKSGKIQEQHSSKSKKGLVSCQSDIPISQDGSLSFLQQFLPLHDSLKLLQEQLTKQRDTLQARHEAQVELLLHRQRDLGDSKSGLVSSSSSPVVVQHSVASQASAKAEPRRIQELYLSEKENVGPSCRLIIPTFQDKSLSFPQHSLAQQENLTILQEQSQIQRVILGAKEGTQEFVHTESELEKRISSEQTGTSSSLSQVDESEGFQECISIKSDSTIPLSHPKIPRCQERLLRVSQHMLPLQDNLEEHQAWLDTEKEAFHISQKTQENMSSEQTGSSSFIPQLVQLSFTSLASAESGTILEPLFTESESKIFSSHLQIPQLQDRLLRISQLIQPQQDNLKALQEQLATQREAIIVARQEAREELLLHQSEWEGRISPEQVDTSNLPLVPQHSFASLPLTESERNQEPCSINSDNMVSSGHSEIPTLPDGLLGLSHLVLPQQDNLIALEEHLHAQTDFLPSIEKTQKELVLSKPCKFEEKVSSEHFIQSHHGDLQALQQQLDTQKKAIRSIQEVQEELLLQRLSELEKRVSSEQVCSSSFVSQVPVADSERTQKSFPTKSNDTLPSSHCEIPRLQDRLLSLSQPILPQQDNMTAQLDAQREVMYSYEKPQEELSLNKQRKLNKSESAEHTIPSLFLPKETEHSFIPLPFAEAKPKSTCELYSSQNEHAAPTSNPVIPGFQDRLLSFSQPVLTQQDNLGLQKQLDLQREVLHYSQKAQEKLLVQRQTALQQQIQKHEETLKDFFKDSQTSKPTVENDLKTQKMGQLRDWFPNTQDLAGNDQENIRHADRNNSDDNHLASEDTSAKQSGEHLEKDLGRRSSKPPVAKVKCGLDLNQHELSAIQEVESPAIGRTSILGKPGIYQDRDPLRVSISREQSFFGSPLAHDPFSCLQPVGQENVCGDDYDEAVKLKESVVENHAVLSYAVEEEHTYLGPTVKPDDKAKTLSHEPLSSATVSTGSLLSYENTDLSLTDPESFSEHMDDSKQESTTSKEEETNIISSIVPSTQDIYQQQNSSDVHKSLLPAVDETTCGHTHFQQMIDKYINEANLIPEKTDLQELEHIFPNLHHQLFKPLEPHPDFDLSSSSSSGISPDNRDFYQRSDSSSESHCATGLSKSTVYFTALRRTSMHSSLNTSLNQQPDTNLAHVGAHSFATENIIGGSEQCFEQLQPEYSSQEESQHADLPSIFSIEARDSSQGMKNQNYPSEEHTEILQNKKKIVHFQLSVGNFSVYSSSDEANVFDQLNVQHSTPCGSNSSECSTKHQLESRKESMGFEELSKRGVVTMLQSQGLIEDNKNETCRVLDINPQVEETDSRLCVRTVEMGTSIQAPYSLTTQNEKYFENSAETDIPKITKKLSQLGESELFASSGSFSLQSSIPVWETETGHGIMEEPELTLVSTTDTSIAEMDFANLTLEEKSENEAKSFFQVSEFLPLVSATEASDYPAVSELSIEKPRTASTGKPWTASTLLMESRYFAYFRHKFLFPPAETPRRLTPIPGSLQEAFIKRKKSFMERSHQRQKEIRNKIHVSENSHIKTVKEKPSISSSVSHLKGVNKVTASFPEDRKTTQALRHQRDLRLYNQLAEVKQQKEEKTKQEAYAQNRARAKEFHKVSITEEEGLNFSSMKYTTETQIFIPSTENTRETSSQKYMLTF
nr:centrosomal protein of 295 kDa isoform X16 [Pan paniscus]